MVFEVDTDNGAPREFEDPEEAVRFAVRSARRVKSTRWVEERVAKFKPRLEIATVQPSGQVDLTFYGGSIVSCQNPQTFKDMLE